ncbi:HAMP domain-containing sensor histidine kinase [Pseudoclostridium thermosuccinogenes]|uniref:sensor histidine kinase n=1 Tax=Clostridium thermosuccinogenes TaxID=84032 RepID=UPI002FD998CE
MNLKKRLTISNAALVIIPFIITIVASLAYIYVSAGLFRKDISYESLENFTKKQYEIFQASSILMRDNPERVMEKDFQQDIAERLSAVDVDVIFLKDYEVIFSTRKLSKIDLEKCIHSSDEIYTGKSIYLSGIPFIVRTIPLNFKDGSSGWVIFLAPVEGSEKATQNFAVFSLLVFIISYLATSLLMSYVLSKSILQPLARLKVSAGEISHGNLDYEVIVEGDDEIKELCGSFEQMRLKLKESVHTQMKYDENRKMLVSSISHDLKTPITSIKGYVEGIMDGVANTPEKLQKYLKTIYSKALQVDGMIDDLLLYSKLDLKQIPFNFEKTDIVKYFEDSIADNETELEKYNIKIELHNELKECRYVLIDRDRMRRVVVNIIDNARKYMNKAEGKIDIILRETNSSIVVEIRDNGAGIPKAAISQVFDRFYRADASRSKISGSGLGLAIAKQIVEGHGGKIWARSHENQGTSIMISLGKVM